MRQQTSPVRMDSAFLLGGAVTGNQSAPTVQTRLMQSAVSIVAVQTLLYIKMGDCQELLKGESKINIKSINKIQNHCPCFHVNGPITCYERALQRTDAMQCTK